MPRTSLTGSEKQSPRKSSSFPSGPMNLFPCTLTQELPEEQDAVSRMARTTATKAERVFLFIVIYN